MSAPPIPSAPADLELIAQLKSKLQYAELWIRMLEERLRLASDRIVIDTVVSKYCNHTPLHGQSMILERRELISGSYIQADETPVDVQTRECRGKNHQAYLGQYSRPGGSAVFDFRLRRGRDGPGGSWDSSKAFSKPTAMQRMTKSAGLEWYMPLLGLMQEDSFSKQHN